MILQGTQVRFLGFLPFHRQSFHFTLSLRIG